MFKSADPTRRVPVYLQAYTKENVVWQLKLTAVFLAGMYALEYVRERREAKRLHTPMPSDI